MHLHPGGLSTQFFSSEAGSKALPRGQLPCLSLLPSGEGGLEEGPLRTSLPLQLGHSFLNPSHTRLQWLMEQPFLGPYTGYSSLRY